MAEINDLNINDASNTARFPEGQAPSTVNNGARALEGLIARWHRDTNASVVTTGTGSAYVYAANQTLLAYYDGLLLGVDFHATCGAAPTLNADALGAVNLTWPNGTALAAGDVVAGQKALIVYDSTGPAFVVLTAGGSAAARNVGAAATNLPAANQPFTDIASATTTAIGGVNSLNVRITGTTTITSFGTIDDGIFRRVRFAGALTLTHNATSLILKGGANILTAANDTADFVSLGSGNWLCVNYDKASGNSVISAGLVPIGSVTASNQATVDFTSGITSTYKKYLVTYDQVIPVTDAQAFRMRLGAGSFDTGASAYRWNAGTGAHTAESSIHLTTPSLVGNLATEGLSGLVWLNDPSNASHYTTIKNEASVINDAGTIVNISTVGMRVTQAADDRCQFFFNAGNVSSGEFRLYGYS